MKVAGIAMVTKGIFLTILYRTNGKEGLKIRLRYLKNTIVSVIVLTQDLTKIEWSPNLYTLFFYKNPGYKNHEAQISEILRIF